MADHHGGRPRPPGTGTECSGARAGWPGRPAARGSRRPRRRPPGRTARRPAPADGARPGPGGGRGRSGRTTRPTTCRRLEVTEHHRLARGPGSRRARPSPARPPPRRRRVVGQHHLDDDGIVGLALGLADHERPGVGGGRPVDGPAGVPGPVGADAAGLARRRTGPAAGRRRRRRRAGSAGRPARRAAGPRAAAGAAGPRPPGPTTAARRARTRPPPRRPTSSTPRRAGHQGRRRPSGPPWPAHGPGPGPPGSSGRIRTGRSASRSSSTAAAPPGRRTGTAVQVTPGPAGRDDRGEQPGDQHGGQQGADGLDPARAARVGHAGPGEHGDDAADHRAEPGHRVDPSAEPDARGTAAGPAGRRRVASRHETGRPASAATARCGPGRRGRGPEERPTEHGDAPTRPAAIPDQAPAERRTAPSAAPPGSRGGTGVSAMIRPTRPDRRRRRPSATSRWERQATATAWMSSGVT